MVKTVGDSLSTGPRTDELRRWLRAERLALRLTQAQLADLAGYSRSSLARFEGGIGGVGISWERAWTLIEAVREVRDAGFPDSESGPVWVPE